MAALSFVKMEAIGNDFVVLDARVLRDALGLPAQRFDAADFSGDGPIAPLARRLCDRRFGVGGDGVLLAEPAPGGLSMRIFNADGTEDTMCGNGLRCVVRFLTTRSDAPKTGVAQTRSGRIPYELSPDGPIRLTLPPPSFDPEKIPLAPDIALVNGGLPVEFGHYSAIYPVNTGSTHSVLLVDFLPSGVFFVVSPKIEYDPRFPERTSVMWCEIVDANTVSLRIWERGVGETLGCGTGACAAAVVARRRGWISDSGPIAVRSRGGIVTVETDGESFLTLIGDAREIFSGVVSRVTSSFSQLAIERAVG